MDDAADKGMVDGARVVKAAMVSDGVIMSATRLTDGPL